MLCKFNGICQCSYLILDVLQQWIQDFGRGFIRGDGNITPVRSRGKAPVKGPLHSLLGICQKLVPFLNYTTQKHCEKMQQYFVN